MNHLKIHHDGKTPWIFHTIALPRFFVIFPLAAFALDAAATVVAAGYYGSTFTMIGWLLSFGIILYMLMYTINKKHVYADAREIANGQSEK